MGLLNNLSYNAAAMLSGAGQAGQIALLQAQKDQALQDRDTLIEQMRQGGENTRQQVGIQATKDAAAAAPALAGQKAGAEADATAASTVKNADALRAAKTADAKAAAQAAIDVQTDPTNVDKQAAAAAAAAKAKQSTEMALRATLVNTPGALDNLKKLTLAEHPEQAAQIALATAQTAASNFSLQTAKELESAKKTLAAAKTPEDIAAAKQVVQGLEYSVATDRAEQAANAAMLTSLHGQMQVSQTLLTNPMSSDDDKARASQELKNLQAAADALTKRYLDNQGVKPAAATLPPNRWDSATGDVFKDGVKVGSAKSEADARSMIAKPAPKPGMLNTPGASGGY